MTMKSKKWIKAFLKNDDGVTAIEYCMAGAFIGAVIIGSLSALGPQISGHLGNAFKPSFGPVAAAGGSESESKGNNSACTGNCGAGVGNGGGNGTDNEGKGVGPGENKGVGNQGSHS